MSGFRGYIRKCIHPITHSVLRRNRVTNLFIENVYEQVRNHFFDGKGLRQQYKSISKRNIYKQMGAMIFKCVALKPTIANAFTWSTTIQGHDFWYEIETQIIQECENLQ